MRMNLIFNFLLIFSFIKAENPCGYMYPQTNGKWGHSLLWIKPGNSIKVYDKPNGKVTGKVEYSLVRYSLIYKPDSLLKDPSIFWEDLTWVGHTSVPLLRVLEYNQGFCKILSATVVNGVWAKIDDIDNNSIRILNLKDLLFGNDNNLPKEIQQSKSSAKIGINLENCLNLRTLPSLKSKILTCIPSNGRKNNYNFITHLEILKSKGNWAYVKVITKKYSPLKGEENDCAYDLYKVQRGWVKVFSDEGYPNIWFSVSDY